LTGEESRAAEPPARDGAESRDDDGQTSESLDAHRGSIAAFGVLFTRNGAMCKLLLLSHAFDTLGCKVVGLRTDNFNFRFQRAIEGLGAKKDGVIRHHGMRRDGSARDTVMYSILAEEWPDVRRHLELRLARHAGPMR
jgi:hypothetical protein